MFENCELILFSKNEVISFEVGEDFIFTDNGVMITRLKLKVSSIANKDEDETFEVFGCKGVPTENGMPLTRNTFYRFLKLNDITQILITFDDNNKILLFVPFENDEFNEDLIIEKGRDRCFVDSEGNLNISITLNPKYLNNVPKK